MFDHFALPPVHARVVLRAWLEPTAPITATIPKQPSATPEFWTVVTTATGYANANVGDMSVLPDGNYTCDISQLLKIGAKTFAAPRTDLINLSSESTGGMPHKQHRDRNVQLPRTVTYLVR